MKNFIFLLFLSLCTAVHAPAQATLPPEMVFVQGGKFTMGCTPEQQPCNGYESPTRVIKINSFFLAKTEITGDQWKILMGFDQVYSSCGLDCPAFGSYYDCLTYCNRLSLQQNLIPAYYFDRNFTQIFDTLVNDTLAYFECYWNEMSNGFRLPMESEWEYAARGANKPHGFKYAGSNDMNNVGWYDGNSGAAVHLVAQKLPCYPGTYDMSGNLFEWNFDLTHSYSGFPSCILDKKYILRGGSYFNNSVMFPTRVTARTQNGGGKRWGIHGFRLARNAD